jgi:hypothetical protein
MLIIGTLGNDTLTGTSSDDTIFALNGNDVVYGGQGKDTLDGGGNDDSLYGGEAEDSLRGGTGNDLLDGGQSKDTLDGGDGDDTLNGQDGEDSLSGGKGDDSLTGDQGQDTLNGNAGNDRIFAGSGDDRLFGGDDADFLDGGDGNDNAEGGDGNDTLTGGIGGVDRLYGGKDADVFRGPYGPFSGDFVDGGEGGNDDDRLNLEGVGPYRIVYSATNSEDGRIEFLDSWGNATGSMEFRNIERIIPCFTPGSQVMTAKGPVAVEDLREGDRIVTRDDGFQAITWIGKRHLDRAELGANARFQPVRIAAGALGKGMPERDMLVSPNHRMLMVADANQLLFSDREVLVAAKHLVGRSGIVQAVVPEVTYVHFMFEQHQVVHADGAWTESFQPGEMALGGLENQQRAEIMALFPALKRHEALLAG